MITELDDPAEALPIAKRVSEKFGLPTFSKEGKKVFTENQPKD